MKPPGQRVHALIDELLGDDRRLEGDTMADLGRLWRDYLRPHRGLIRLCGMAAVIAAAADLLFPLTGRYLADHVLQVQDPIAAADLSRHLARVPVYVGMLVAIWCVVIAGQWVQSWMSLSVVRKVTYRLREDLHAKLQLLHIAYYEKTPTGKILSRVIDDVNTIRGGLADNGVQMLSFLTRVVGGVALILWLNWRLSLLIIVCLPLYGAAFAVLRPKIRRSSIALRRLHSALYARASERVGAIDVVTAFAREKGEFRAFAHSVFDYIRLGNLQVHYTYLLSMLAGLLATAIGGLALYLCAVAVRDGDMTLGDMMAYYYTVVNMMAPVNNLVTGAMEIQAVQVVLRRVFHLLDEPVGVESGAVELEAMTGRITFDHVTFTYPGQSQPALDDLSLVVEPAERVAIMGPSGAGKSTLFELLLRFYDPQSGTIRVDDVDLVDASVSSLRRQVCLVQQEPVVLSGTLAENIAYGRVDATADQIRTACERAELHDFIMSLPIKYETEVGEHGVALSGGQRQRLALATALLTDPVVLLLDDTTSALDAATEAKIRATLAGAMENRTSLIITQRVATARACDRIVVLEKGRVAQRGSHDELLAQPGFYRLVAQQQGIVPRDAD